MKKLTWLVKWLKTMFIKWCIMVQFWMQIGLITWQEHRWICKIVKTIKQLVSFLFELFFLNLKPPFLSTMVYEYYLKTKDQNWLKQQIPAIEKFYEFFTTKEHLVPEIGLSRYFDFGKGAAPEVVKGEEGKFDRKW